MGFFQRIGDVLSGRGRQRERPEWGEYVSGARVDHDYDSSVLNLSPRVLGKAMREADTGNTTRLYEIFKQVERDPHVYATITKRRRNAINKTLVIAPASEDDGLAQKASDLCNEVIFGSEGGEVLRGPVPGIRGWSQALFDLTDAIGKAYALAQLVWEPHNDVLGGQWRIAEIKRWPHRDTRLGDPTKRYAQDEDQVRILTAAERYRGEELQPWHWLLHRYKATSDTLSQAQLLRVVAWYFLFKKLSSKDWAIFCDAYGMPRRVGKYRSGDNNDRGAVINALKKLGRDGWVVIPEGAEIEMLSAKAGTGEIPFSSWIRVCDEQISKAILGGTLGTDAGEKGARSLGEVHKETERELTEADCKSLAETLREQLLRPIVLFNLGPTAPLPTVEFQISEDEDLNARSERDVRLLEAGLPIARSYFYERYGIPEPEDEDDLLEVPGGTLAARDVHLAGKLAELSGRDFSQLVEALAEKKKTAASRPWAR